MATPNSPDTDPNANAHWQLVRAPDDRGIAPSRPDRDESADDPAAVVDDPVEPPPDPDAWHFQILPPNDAPAELIVIDAQLNTLQAVIDAAVQDGYWVHGPRQFDILRSGLNADPLNIYRGSHEPLRLMPRDDYQRIAQALGASIAAESKRIAAARATVQQQAAHYAAARLRESSAQIAATTVRLIKETSTAGGAQTWLKQNTTGPASTDFTFNEAGGYELVMALLQIRTAQRELDKQQMALARTMRAAGPAMQAVAAKRAATLWRSDPKNTRRHDRYSPAYGQYLVDYDNPARPDLVAKVKAQYPDPPEVGRAYEETLAAAAALTDTLTTLGETEPLLFRIFSLELGNALARRLAVQKGQVDVSRAMETLFGREPLLIQAVQETLRVSYAAVTELDAQLTRQPALVWDYPLLIQATLDSMDLSATAYERTVAMHELDELQRQAQSSQRALMRVSEVLIVAELVAMAIPAPQVSLPARVALGAIDAAVGGIGLLMDYMQTSGVRLGFRAFLNPSESFAVNDGSYLGTVLGTAFLIFGVGSLFRTTLQPLTKGAVALTAGVIAGQEALIARERQP